MSSDNEEPELPHLSPFESIRKVSEDGIEYWSARDLSKVLGYTEYSKFKNAIQKAEEACQNSDQAVSDHFAQVSDMIEVGKGGLFSWSIGIVAHKSPKAYLTPPQ